MRKGEGGMKCLVTGATGFLGTNLVHELVKLGWTVRAFGLIGSNAAYIDDLPVEILYGDITNKRDVETAVKGCDYVFHVAGDTSWWRKRFEKQREINVGGVLNVAEACIKFGVKRLVHTSTVDALGYNPHGIADESWQIYNYANTGYNYADTKREGELCLKSLVPKGLDYVVVYPGSMLGPFDFTLQYGRLFFELRDGKTPGCPSGGVSFGHATEVARGHIQAALHGKSGEGYICAGENISYRDFFDHIAKKFGKRAPRFDIGRGLLVGYGYLMQFLSRFTNRPPELDPGTARYMSINAYYDSTKAQNELNYQIRPMKEMIDDAYDWYVKHGYLDEDKAVAP